MVAKGFKNLEKCILNSVDRAEHSVFLHPGEKRGYTDDELAAVKHRDFETRLFMAGTPCNGDSVFLRHHFTDNVEHASNFNYVRDYLKAFHLIQNWTCAKSVLSTLLTMCFQLESSGYYTFAISLASGLSRNGENTDFEGSLVSDPSFSNSTVGEDDSRSEVWNDNTKDESVHKNDDLSLIRRKFCFLMDVVFKRLAIRKFLVDDERSNIYRIIHCQTKYSDNKKPLVIALFAFVLQISLTAYVLLEFLLRVEAEEDSDFRRWKMLPLAISTSLHSLMIAVPNLKESVIAYQVFGKFGPLQMMDLLMSAIIPLVLTVAGFLVIYLEESFIEGVLNSTALLFIPEIDDQLPFILGLRTEEIVKNFLVAESITRFDAIADLKDTDFSASELEKITCGVQFSDFYLTNTPEQGNSDGTPFQPFKVIADTNNMGHQIDPSSFVTVDCLLKRIEWKYTTGYPRTTNPRIGYLHLTKINDEVVEIVRKDDPMGIVGIEDHSHSLHGLFIITTFQMSEDILKLRVCGSYNPPDFLKALNCYSLWDVNAEAKSAISALPPDKGEEDGFDTFYDT